MLPPPDPIGSVQVVTRARALADSAAHTERTIERLAEFGEVDAERVVRRQLWGWRLNALRSEADLDEPWAEATAALQRIQEVRECVSAASPLLALQGRVEALPLSEEHRVQIRECQGEGAAPWSGLPQHPWALGGFVSVVVGMTRITLAPPLWDVLLWSLFGATAAILFRRCTDAHTLRPTVHLLGGSHPAFLLLESSRLREPVFRVRLAAVAAFAIPRFLLLARDEGCASGSGSRCPRARAGRTWPPWLGAGSWIAVLVGLVSGFDSLTRRCAARHRRERRGRLHGEARLRPGEGRRRRAVASGGGGLAGAPRCWSRSA